MITVYWDKKCSTCRDAVDFLSGRKVALGDFRDIRLEPLKHAEIRRLAKLAGGVHEVFSTRSIFYREHRLAEQNLSDDQIITLIAQEWTLLRRPIFVQGGKIFIGANPRTLLAMLGK